MKLTKSFIRKVITEVLNENAELRNIEKVIKGKNLMQMRTPLETIYKKSDITFTTEPMAMYVIKSKTGGNKSIAIINKKNATPGPSDIVCGEYVIGYLN